MVGDCSTAFIPHWEPGIPFLMKISVKCIYKGRLQIRFAMKFLSASEWGGGGHFRLKKLHCKFLVKNGHFYHDFWAKCMKNGERSNPKKNIALFWPNLRRR